MARIILDFPSVCQMSDRLGKPSSRQPELLGYGSGGNRCTEACNAGIAWKLNLDNVQGRFTYPEDVMFWFTEQRNGGRDVSAPRNGQEVVDWVNGNGGKMWGIGATYADIVAMVNRGNVGMAGFGDYNKLTKANGQSPYSWHDPDGDGHVLMVVGYNTDVSPNTIFVHDSLLGDNFQPTEYSWAGFQNAQFNSLSEVQIRMVPAGWKDDPNKKILTAPNGITVESGFYNYVLSHNWDSSNVPLAPSYSCPDQVSSVRNFGPGSRQDFSFLSLGWTAKIGYEFVLPAGEELVAAQAAAAQKAADDQQIVALNKQIADLKAQLAAGPDPKVHQALVQVRTSLQSSVDLASVIDAALKEI